jgi:hypothetical protein
MLCPDRAPYRAAGAETRSCGPRAQFDRTIFEGTRRRVPAGSGWAREQLAIILSPSRSMISSCNALVRVVDNRAEGNVRVVR